MSSHAGPRTGRPPSRGDRGMVAAPHHLATGAGVAALRRGGSAIDAAIATNAVLCVVYPHMAGLGGDGFWLLHDGHGVQGLNASGPAAAAATPDWYRSRGHAAIPWRGGAAALTVPGAVDGWRLAHERHGRLEWGSLFADAIHWARSGAPVGRSLADWLAADVDVLRADDEAARTFLPGGRARRDGERLVLDDLADAFEVLAADGARAGFYEGRPAERLCAGAARAGSPLRAEDLAAYRAEWVEPISVTYRDRVAHELPPNTQGFAALQVLKLLEGFDVGRWPDGGVEQVHHVAEAVKLAFADRNEWLADPRSVAIPLDRLLSDAYLDERRQRIDAERALVMDQVEPGIRFGPGDRRGERGGGDTCAFSAVDGDGLAVSVIQSVYHDFGAAVVAPGTGILLQNRGSSFSLDEDHPNRLEPGKRPFHTLIPALLTRGGRPELVHGTMGGDGQPQTQAAVVTRVVDHGYDVQQAIEAPRWLMGRTWGARSQDLWLEGRIDDQVARELELRGQPVRMLADWADDCGHAQAIRIDHERGLFEGGADPRGDGSAEGW